VRSAGAKLSTPLPRAEFEAQRQLDTALFDSIVDAASSQDERLLRVEEVLRAFFEEIAFAGSTDAACAAALRALKELAQVH
jgi:hypothetical protein